MDVKYFFFFFNDTATTEIYTLSLHDALPICWPPPPSHLIRARSGSAWRRDDESRRGRGERGIVGLQLVQTGLEVPVARFDGALSAVRRPHTCAQTSRCCSHVGFAHYRRNALHTGECPARDGDQLAVWLSEGHHTERGCLFVDLRIAASVTAGFCRQHYRSAFETHLPGVSPGVGAVSFRVAPRSTNTSLSHRGIYRALVHARHLCRGHSGCIGPLSGSGHHRSRPRSDRLRCRRCAHDVRREFIRSTPDLGPCGEYSCRITLSDPICPRSLELCPPRVRAGLHN